MKLLLIILTISIFIYSQEAYTSWTGSYIDIDWNKTPEDFFIINLDNYITDKMEGVIVITVKVDQDAKIVSYVIDKINISDSLNVIKYRFEEKTFNKQNNAYPGYLNYFDSLIKQKLKDLYFQINIKYKEEYKLLLLKASGEIILKFSVN